MRAFSILAAITALAFSVNAAPQSKRAISDNVQSCVNGLASIDLKVLELTDSVNAFTSAGSYPALGNVEDNVEDVTALTKSSSTACGAITTTISDEEATAVFTQFDAIVSDTTTTLDSFVSKKSEFEALQNGNAVERIFVIGLRSEFKALDNTLITVTPESLRPSVQAKMDAFHAKLDSTLASLKSATTN